ncbi:hypothetical protein BYT27DRAFT_7252560 [Phlegmacium glaucopus]|nr:hypothetical protein BYT27DRAFT_7252560 [Phlegmacium glaucopus]
MLYVVQFTNIRLLVICYPGRIDIQSVARPADQKVQKRPWTQKNPLVNKTIPFRLNPYAKTLRRQENPRVFEENAAKPKQSSTATKAYLENLFAP